MKKAWTYALAMAVGSMSLQGHAQMNDENLDINLKETGAYVSNTYGNGYNSEGGDMQNRALEVRFGKELKGRGPGDSKVRIDFIHYNEGHPQNNHRDGIATQVVFRKDISDRVKAEFGIGPYFTMNTTTVDGVELDDKRLGVLATAAVLYYFTSNGWHIRAQYNHVNVPGASRSDAVLVGLGKDFGVSNYRDSRDFDPNSSIWLNVAAGNTITNHGGTNPSANAQIELKKYYGGGFAWSVAAIHEGDDDVRRDRDGVAVQAWYVQPVTEKTSVSAGVGPYFAVNKRGSNNVELNALVSVRVERTIGSKKLGLKVYVDASRVVSASGDDTDKFQFGFGKNLK